MENKAAKEQLSQYRNHERILLQQYLTLPLCEIYTHERGYSYPRRIQCIHPCVIIGKNVIRSLRTCPIPSTAAHSSRAALPFASTSTIRSNQSFELTHYTPLFAKRHSWTLCLLYNSAKRLFTCTFSNNDYNNHESRTTIPT